jgi:plasmid stabilization system protein ParE
MKVLWSRYAANQFKYIVEYWNERNRSTTYSSRLTAEVNDYITLIARQPLAGKITDFPGVDKIRCIVCMKHYSILYHIDDTHIHIVAFWDNRQNPDSLNKIIYNP